MGVIFIVPLGIIFVFGFLLIGLGAVITANIAYVIFMIFGIIFGLMGVASIFFVFGSFGKKIYLLIPSILYSAFCIFGLSAWNVLLCMSKKYIIDGTTLNNSWTLILPIVISMTIICICGLLLLCAFDKKFFQSALCGILVCMIIVLPIILTFKTNISTYLSTKNSSYEAEYIVTQKDLFVRHLVSTSNSHAYSIEYVYAINEFDVGDKVYFTGETSQQNGVEYLEVYNEKCIGLIPQSSLSEQ